jgi:hypothetical protein
MPHEIFLKSLTRLYRAGVITVSELCNMVLERDFQVSDIKEDTVVYHLETDVDENMQPEYTFYNVYTSEL